MLDQIQKIRNIVSPNPTPIYLKTTPYLNLLSIIFPHIKGDPIMFLFSIAAMIFGTVETYQYTINRNIMIILGLISHLPLYLFHLEHFIIKDKDKEKYKDKKQKIEHYKKSVLHFVLIVCLLLLIYKTTDTWPYRLPIEQAVSMLFFFLFLYWILTTFTNTG